MQGVYGWFGTLRRILSFEVYWFLWWGLFLAGFATLWWYPLGRWPSYIWFACLCIFGAIYADSWRDKCFTIFVGLNSLIKTTSLYILFLKYLIVMPEPVFGGIVIAIGVALPIAIYVSFVARLAKVLSASTGNERSPHRTD